ncbi:hypothetical protein CEXT_770781 [Caerostris extrusa]|uniref:Uncharacterized protein n=1 Tax=Caerostris extrusa TaxID=172846 RepID=A0AAV4QFA7_CAEEX|nr:hypothetical protein CEXT_770781 [Caerostris extrusa]
MCKFSSTEHFFVLQGMGIKRAWGRWVLGRGGACHRGCCADDPSDDQKGARKGTSELKHVWTVEVDSSIIHILPEGLHCQCVSINRFSFLFQSAHANVSLWTF